MKNEEVFVDITDENAGQIIFDVDGDSIIVESSSPEHCEFQSSSMDDCESDLCSLGDYDSYNSSSFVDSSFTDSRGNGSWDCDSSDYTSGNDEDPRNHRRGSLAWDAYDELGVEEDTASSSLPILLSREPQQAPSHSSEEDVEIIEHIVNTKPVNAVPELPDDIIIPEILEEFISSCGTFTRFQFVSSDIPLLHGPGVFDEYSERQAFFFNVVITAILAEENIKADCTKFYRLPTEFIYYVTYEYCHLAEFWPKEAKCLRKALDSLKDFFTSQEMEFIIANVSKLVRENRDFIAAGGFVDLLKDFVYPSLYFSRQSSKKLTNLRGVRFKDLIDSSEAACSICLTDFNLTSVCTVLSCLHIFHRDCAKQWLSASRRCPACRVILNDLTV